MADSILQDPLGRKIVLHDCTWYGHIVKGHPEVRGARPLVERAVQAPSVVHFSSSDPKCRIYYGTGVRPGTLIAVVADVVNGFIKTAYLAAKAKGAIEWSPSTHSKGR